MQTQSAHKTAQAVPVSAVLPASATPLKFITCGSVDDGKSTLIGRLLWDCKAVFDDQAEKLAAGQIDPSANPDFARLLDGLQIEQEQGITIDVAYRYFSTPRRSFIVADTPGHEQYTRNMATGCSQASLAVLLSDARSGIIEQTRRHISIARLMGIEQFILVVNKMDLVGYSEQRFHEIAADFREIMLAQGVTRFHAVPTNAVAGTNVVHASPGLMDWYEGGTVLDYLESAPATTTTGNHFRFSIQRVSRPDESFRGYQGTLEGGSIKPGDEVLALPSGRRALVTQIVTYDLVRNAAVTGDAVTLVLDRDIDLSRGDALVSPSHPAIATDAFAAKAVWLSERDLDPARRYLVKASHRTVTARLVPRTVHDLHRNRWEATDRLGFNMIGTVDVASEEALILDPFLDNRKTGSFIVIDPETFETVAAGMVQAMKTSGTVSRIDGQPDVVTLTFTRAVAERLLNDPAFADYRQHLLDQ